MVILENITFAFGGAAVLTGVSGEIRQGEIFTVLGPNGAGKSVLLRILAGLLAPDGGRVRYRGRVGMAFQRNGLFDSLPAAENLRFPLKELTDLSETAIADRVGEALAQVGLAGQGGLAVSELSGGMQKRLGIARALILAPELVLFDDPAAGLDPITGRAITDLIREGVRRRGLTAVVATCDPNLADSLSDRVGFLFGGKFQEISTPRGLDSSENPAVRQFLRGLPEGPLTRRSAP